MTGMDAAVLAGHILSGRQAVRVPRDSAPGEFCVVRRLPGGTWKGTCPDHDYRQHDCKHIIRVRNRVQEMLAAGQRAG